MGSSSACSDQLIRQGRHAAAIDTPVLPSWLTPLCCPPDGRLRHDWCCCAVLQLARLDEALMNLQQYTFLAFTSKNGIIAVLERLEHLVGGAWQYCCCCDLLSGVPGGMCVAVLLLL